MKLCKGDIESHTECAFEDGDDCPACEYLTELEEEKDRRIFLQEKVVNLEMEKAELQTELGRMGTELTLAEQRIKYLEDTFAH